MIHRLLFASHSTAVLPRCAVSQTPPFPVHSDAIGTLDCGLPVMDQIPIAAFTVCTTNEPPAAITGSGRGAVPQATAPQESASAMPSQVVAGAGDVSVVRAVAVDEARSGALTPSRCTWVGRAEAS